MKDNQRVGTHRKEFKIPVRDRKLFMGSNKSKWVDKKRYQKYIRWKKEGRKPMR